VTRSGPGAGAGACRASFWCSGRNKMGGGCCRASLLHECITAMPAFAVIAFRCGCVVVVRVI
jgi:hypothetical protein